ncbi:amidohydrolase family protein [Ancylobacter vacuolatus]|uniref:2,3-dihydroxybenzoate decarboxylase n=1 Tax=Ancylobacter vacuolatus TaxID=223389 RepID=A0ABU0DHJ7_9HYPH|nr:amidohydrolase family protein [Ancylobacter vacuolatus]MDQ0347900.1 2,3-dihydroxybenzoate decarboxylase [Ancylobacter vacuolatus]
MSLPAPSARVPKIGLEEHFITPGLTDYLLYDFPHVPEADKKQLLGLLSDFGEGRLSAMDRAGIEIAVLSVTGPGVQAEPDAAIAIARAAEANDALAGEIARRPHRYAGFAHLAMQDPARAADELERCVRQLGFKGAMVNHHTNGVYLDHPSNDVFWERLQALDVPLYLHPGNAFIKPHVLAGVPELHQPMWEWTTETATHALRLVVTGVFDRFPRAQLILGHAGETLPYMLWRLDSRYQFVATERRLKRPPSAYLRENVSVTLSGQFADVPLQAALAALGSERVMFSADYPYESLSEAADFMDTTPLPDAVRAAVAAGNARRLLRL